MLENYIYHLKAVLNLSIAFVVICIVVYATTAFLKYLEEHENKLIRPISFKGNEIISVEMLGKAISTIVRFFQWIFILSIVYISIPFVLQEIPQTHDYAIDLMDSIQKKFWLVVDGVLSFIPNLFFIFFALFITRTILRFLKFIFVKIEKKEILIDGFYSDWANTTFQLLRFLIIVFSIVVIYPYMPGAGTKALEGVTIILGVMVSLGSSSAIANIIAGIMISYMRAFRKDNYIKIGTTIGRVSECGLIVTKIITYKNEEVTIPNTQILSSQIINYSTLAASGDLIVYPTVTIGYDAPWPLVHQILIEAAMQTELISSHKRPFVLQTALNDYNISYQLNAYTNHANLIPTVYSQLYENLQIAFAKHNIEILSPQFTVLRDGKDSTIPDLEKF